MKNGGGCATGGKTGVRQARRRFAPSYHYDSLSGFRVGISDSIWQQGNLRAGKFADTGTYPLIGQRDAAIARKIEYATSDLEPDPKLVQPDQASTDVFF
jgi:hypothetical protein